MARADAGSSRPSSVLVVKEGTKVRGSGQPRLSGATAGMFVAAAERCPVVDAPAAFRLRAVVPMVEASDLRNRDDGAIVGRHDWTGNRRILVECQVRARSFVVGAIARQQPRTPASLNTITWSKHSRRADPTNRSPNAFCHGACGACARPQSLSPSPWARRCRRRDRGRGSDSGVPRPTDKPRAAAGPSTPPLP